MYLYMVSVCDGGGLHRCGVVVRIQPHCAVLHAGTPALGILVLQLQEHVTWRDNEELVYMCIVQSPLIPNKGARKWPCIFHGGIWSCNILENHLL